MSNIVKNVDNRNGIINQTIIKNYLILKPQRWFQKKFRKKKYYDNLSHLCNKQLQKKLDTQKNNKKYIPEVFLELNDVKENLRYITQPILFYKKNIDELKNIEFYYFNEILQKLGFEKKELTINDNLTNPKKTDDIDPYIKELKEIINNFKKSIPNLDEKEELKQKLSKEQYELSLKEYGIHRRFNRFLERFEKKFDLLNKKFILLTEKAGQGKTNLVCDFVDNVILKKTLFAIMFTGSEFNNLDKNAIEDIILKNVYGFESSIITFSDFLDDIEYLCKKENKTFTIIIDGLNENSNIEYFSKELYKFCEQILEKDFIRLVFTCRSEYFEERFKIFKNPSFKKDMLLMDNYMNRNYQREKLPEFLEDRLLDSYFKFFQVENIVFNNVRKQLSNDFLLLRIFSEVYGKRTNPNPPIEQVYDIYKDELFKNYFEYKKQEIQAKTNYSITDFQQLFTEILSYMIENNQYINIPFEDLKNINRELLNHIIDEDIFFRKDIIKDKTSVLANKEVLNFTFDEFRDYLLADYLSVYTTNIEDFINSINPDDTSFEGIEKYLFIKSRKLEFREKLKFLESLEHYDRLFLNNIFSVNDKNIQKDDIEKIKSLFIKDYKYSKYIIHFLMYRHYTNLYKKLNIFTLFEIIKSLNNEEYMELVNPKFKIEYEYYSRNRKSILLDLLEQLNKILEIKDFSKNYQYHNIFEFMFLLLRVEDESEYGNAPYELTKLLKEYIAKYPIESKAILLKYKEIQIDKIKFEIWKLLRYYSEKNANFDKEFCQELFARMETEDDEKLKNIFQDILEQCYEYNNENFTKKQINFFIALKKEREEQAKFFQDLANGKVDYEELLKKLDMI